MLKYISPIIKSKYLFLERVKNLTGVRYYIVRGTLDKENKHPHGRVIQKKNYDTYY